MTRGTVVKDSGQGRSGREGGAAMSLEAQVVRTLGHPIRLRIVCGLAEKCACVKDIWECLELPQAVVSQHLKVMKAAGILEARREGNRVCYSLKAGLPAALAAVLRGSPD